MSTDNQLRGRVLGATSSLIGMRCALLDEEGVIPRGQPLCPLRLGVRRPRFGGMLTNPSRALQPASRGERQTSFEIETHNRSC